MNTLSKLRLSKETLRQLEPAEADCAWGGGQGRVYTDKSPITAATHCQSGCPTVTC